MIVKNEELFLGNCLSSVRDIVDEIVVADTGSEDATKDIALQYTDKVYDFPWTDDFSSARNYSFEQATKEYILWLDADDIIRPDDQVMLRQLKDSLEFCVDCVMMKNNTGFDLFENITFSFYRERLVKSHWF